MEIKKSPKADLENKKMMAVLIGLVMALGIMYIAFEWSQNEITVYEEALQGPVEIDEEMVEVTFREENPPPPQPETVLSDIIDIQDNEAEVETTDFNSEDEADARVEIQAPIAPPEEEEEEQVIHIRVEKMPEFPGGQEALNRYLVRNIKYPLLAQENGIQGRVVCQFVVNSDGSIVDISVVRGVEESLDKEAIRVIKSMPKWTPGRQGGNKAGLGYLNGVSKRKGESGKGARKLDKRVVEAKHYGPHIAKTFVVQNPDQLVFMAVFVLGDLCKLRIFVQHCLVRPAGGILALLHQLERERKTEHASV